MLKEQRIEEHDLRWALNNDIEQGWSNVPFYDQTRSDVNRIISKSKHPKIAEEVDDWITLPNKYKHIYSWLDRETYENPDNEEELIKIATNEISTHGVVHDGIIQWKWKILTQISNYCLRVLDNNLSIWNVKTQLVENPIWPNNFPEVLKQRSVIVKKIQELPIQMDLLWYLNWPLLKYYNKETWFLKTWLIRVWSVEKQEHIWINLKTYHKFNEPYFISSAKIELWWMNMGSENVVFVLEKWLNDNDYTIKSPTILLDKIKKYSQLIYKYANKLTQKKWLIIWNMQLKFWIDNGWNLVVFDKSLFSDSDLFWEKEWFQEWVEPESYFNQPAIDYVESYWENNPDKNWKKYNDEGFMKYPVKISKEVIEECSMRYKAMWLKYRE